MKIYIAGFDVFRHDAYKYGQRLKKICQRLGHEGLFPLDNKCKKANDIYKGNIDLIKEADIVVANVNPFRGKEPDSGTAFEIGYAVAKKKPVVCYMDDIRPMKEKIKDKQFRVEDFSMPVNLMIGVSTHVVKGGFGDALLYVNQHLNKDD